MYSAFVVFWPTALLNSTNIIELDKERRKRIFELTAEGNGCEREYK